MSQLEKRSKVGVRIALTIVLLLTCIVFFIGIELYSGIAPQKAVGYPNSGQLKLYVLFPAASVLISALMLTFSKKLPNWLLIFLYRFNSSLFLRFLFFLVVVCKGVACREMELTLPLAAGGGVSDSWSLGNGVRIRVWIRFSTTRC
ncbi:MULTISPECIES: hypothetical protein [unclassified Pseudomonas]|uniref:hypothetical protein n=1 Tax=unclassified Pseudomonas TaxID=196821 RepID=UPI0011B60B11|nr:hypothetical protein [Pseudomonas sp. URMO17WK12:I6]